MLPFRPIETLPGKPRAGGFDFRQVQTDACEPFGTDPCHLELLVIGRDEKPFVQQPARDGDAETASQVIVAAARELEFLCLAGQCLSTYNFCQPYRREVFERQSHMRAGKAIITMPPLGFDRQQAARQQLAQMGTGRLGGHTGAIGQFAGRSCSTVEQGNEHDGASGIGDQSGCRGDIRL